MKNISSLFLLISVIVLAGCVNHSIVYKNRVICSPGSYPQHTKEEKAQLVKELLPINDGHSMIITYIGEYMTIQKQIDECKRQSSTFDIKR